MTTALLLSLLLAPESGRLWSEKHEIGLTLPNTWKAIERDTEGRVLVAEGPKLGPAKPYLVLRDVASADGIVLEELARTVATELEKRPSWRVTARARHNVGPFPAMRLGVVCEVAGTACRGRVTVMILGGRLFTLELSAASTHFPGAIFDGIEKSIEVKWAEHKLPDGGLLFLPPGWKSEATAAGMRIGGPALGGAPARIFLEPLAKDDEGPPADGKKGPMLKFLGKRRTSVLDEREIDSIPMRMVRTEAEPWSVVVVGAVAGWEDLMPMAAEILSRVKLAG